VLTATSADITGNIEATSGKFGNAQNKIIIGGTTTDINSSIHSESKTSLSTDANGFYVGTDGISLGSITDYDPNNNDNVHDYHSKFEVSSNGDLYASNAIIKGKIDATTGIIGG
jgi:hypothetical protein